MNWRIELLGGLRAICGDQSIAQFRSRKTGALLAYLAYFRGAHPRDKLVELLWPEASVEAGRNSLRVALADLQRRSALPDATGAAFSTPLLEKDRASIALHGSVTTDVEEFEKAVAEARRTVSAQVRVEAYERALELYQGSLLPGFYEDWIPVEEARLEATFLYVVKSLTSYYEKSGDSLRALELTQMAARFESNVPIAPRKSVLPSPPDAVLPQPSTESESEKRVSQPSVVAKEFIAQVPAAFTRFFGRETELRELATLLLDEQVRLVTITGSGGLGKTRLALELARQVERGPLSVDAEQMPRFEHVFWVPLADVTDVERLPESLIKALNLSVKAPEGARNIYSLIEILAHFLRASSSESSRVLLVLDNFEQLLPHGATFLGELLERAPKLVLLVTSRQRLNLSGEQEHRIGSLSLPSAARRISAPWEAETEWNEQQLSMLRDASSVQLFADRARSARADWRLSPRDASALISLLYRLEGVPLAIELVASRAGVLSIEQMLSRLSQSLQWVSSRDLHRPVRHRSLYAVLEWSLQLLPEREREIFARLCVFHGGWTLDDAVAVLADIEADDLLEVLQSLRDASLISSDESKSGQLRFSMLEMVRQIIGERLSEKECFEARRSHADFYFRLAQSGARSEKDITGRSIWGATEGPNFLAALDFLMESDVERALEMAASLWWYWIFNYHLPEGRHYLRELLADPEAKHFPLARARAQGCAAYIALLGGYYDETEQLLDAALAVWKEKDDIHELVGTLNLLGALARTRGNLEESREFYAQSLALRRQTGFPRELAISINALAGIERECGHTEAARQLCDEALAMARQYDDHAAEAWALQTLGAMEFDAANFDTARDSFQKSLALRRRAKHWHAEAACLDSLGDVEQGAGNWESARANYQQALEIWRRINQLPNCQETHKKLDAINEKMANED